MSTTIEDRVIEIAKKIAPDGAPDSLDMVEIAMECEEHFGIENADAELDLVGSLDDLTRLVKRLARAAA